MLVSPPRFPDFHSAIELLKETLRDHGRAIHTEKWQGLDIRKKPEAAMIEVYNTAFAVLIYTRDLNSHRQSIQPNLPWADAHFELERVSRDPVNPGTTWKDWPWANRADAFRTEAEAFNHSYAERYWPKFAGMTEGGRLNAPMVEGIDRVIPHSGIRYNYGDLQDVVNLLAKQPLTRQAYLPVFFPEDTGAVHGGRIPCSIGYHFLCRDGKLHITYQLRSCDFVRHFRDDIYLTVRLLLWVLDELAKKDSRWGHIIPGDFVMVIGSLHLFQNDFYTMFPNLRPGNR